jgi:hypothetical protein
MKIHVLYDHSGEILAAVDLSEQAPELGRLRPIPQEGQSAADFEVPAGHPHVKFVDVVPRLRVNVKAQAHHLILKN